MNKTIAGAGLDVFETEPLPEDSPLRRLDNVVLTSHIGAHTREAQNKMGCIAAQNLIRVLQGEEPLFVAGPTV
ncbi:NAD(P)-dependent oxidoreductase [Capillibacterium thermochitinicola]|uniref:NAD(P)-dependent oxidoreductase n=1 Tax=Capillibacterium thermochitinicola TaxID=2699427 RepID=UPI002F2B2C70